MNHCDKEMNLLTKDYNVYDDVIGEWYWCSVCGTVYYKDRNIRHSDDDASGYMIPLNKKVNNEVQ